MTSFRCLSGVSTTQRKKPCTRRHQKGKIDRLSAVNIDHTFSVTIYWTVWSFLVPVRLAEAIPNTQLLCVDPFDRGESNLFPHCCNYEAECRQFLLPLFASICSSVLCIFFSCSRSFPSFSFRAGSLSLCISRLRREVRLTCLPLFIETVSSYESYDRASCYGLCHVQYDWTFERHGCNPLIWQYTILKAVEGYAARPRWSRRTCGGIIMRTWV